MFHRSRRRRCATAASFWDGLRDQRDEFFAGALKAAAAAGGHATRFRGGEPGAGVFHPLAPAQERIQRNLKKAFDPDGVFNRGRLYPGL